MDTETLLLLALAGVVVYLVVSKSSQPPQPSAPVNQAAQPIVGTMTCYTIAGAPYSVPAGPGGCPVT